MKTIGAFIVFAALFACYLVAEAWGSLRHRKNWESGDGLGCAEDYE